MRAKHGRMGRSCRSTPSRSACAPAPRPTAAAAPGSPAGSAALLFPGEEKHLANVRQLTFGGQNAEAYWSADGRQIIFQSNDEGHLPCDQIYIMNADGTNIESLPQLNRVKAGDPIDWFWGH